MARIVREIEIEGKKLKALFDTGSLRSYIVRKYAPIVTHKVRPIYVSIGGKTHALDTCCIVTAIIDGLEFDFTAYVIEELGETEYGKIDVLIGATCMEEWYIKIDPKNGTIDLSGLRRREFTEF